MAKIPEAIPEHFLAMELAYGCDPTMGDLCAFLGFPDMQLTHMQVIEDMNGLRDKTYSKPPSAKWTTQERLQVSVWVGQYIKWKNPHEFAALDDLHLDKPSKYNPLA